MFVEVPVYVVVGRLLGSVSSGRALGAAVGVNLLTHPIMYAVTIPLAWPARLGAEAIVVVVEALLLAWWWRQSRCAVWIWAAATAANALSTSVGLIALA